MHVLDDFIAIANPRIQVESQHSFSGEFSFLQTATVTKNGSLLLVLEGGCWICVGDEPEVWLSGGDCLVVNSGDDYRICSGGELRPQGHLGDSKVVIVCAALVDRVGPGALFLSLLPARMVMPFASTDTQSAYRKMIALLKTVIHEDGGGAHSILTAFMRAIIVLVLRELMALKTDQPCGLLSLCGHPELSLHVGAIVADPRREWCVEPLAETLAASINQNVLQVSGFVASDVLSKIRILLACSMLASNHSTVSEVGEQVGFGAGQTFIEVFNAHIGCTPAQYRDFGAAKVGR